MDVLEVQSTMLATVAYDEARAVLLLEFRTHSLYQYDGVSVEIYHALLQSSSKGAFFNAHIRGRFAYLRLS